MDRQFPLFREHIRVHEVQRGEDLSELLAEFSWSCASAVVFINTSDEYKLDGSIGEVKDIPVVIVSNKDGKAILKFLNKDTYPQVRIISPETGTDISHIISNGK